MTEVSGASCACATSEPLRLVDSHSCRALQVLRRQERQAPREPNSRREEPPTTRCTRASKFSPSIVPPQNVRKTDRRERARLGLGALHPRCHTFLLAGSPKTMSIIPTSVVCRCLVPLALSTPSSCASASGLTTRSGRISDAIRAHFGHISTSRSRQSLAEHERALVRRPLSLGGGGWSVRHPIAPMRAMTPKSWVMCAGF